jgi:serine/threonine-protein kinase
VVEIGAQVATGLRKAHDSGVIHRDIKTSNIIVDSDERARILDFGLAVISGGLRVTQPGSAMGTPMYMSPEQVEGREVDARSDLFALGVVLYELTTGTSPFKRESKTETVAAVLGASPEPISKLRPDAPGELVAIIDRLMAKDPRERYASAADLLEDLNQLRSGTQTVTIGAPIDPKTPWGLAILAMAAVVIIAGAIAILNPAGPATEEPSRLVVLPFETLGPESEAVVAAAITEEITNRLSRAQDLDVISRTTARRYQGADLDIRQIASELDVTHVLEGTVTWGRGDEQASRARISSRLIRVSDDTPVWQNTFERTMDDVFAVQSEIARSVASALSSVLGEELEPIGGTTDPEAQRLFARGVEYLERPDPYIAQDAMVATELLKQATDLDPQFARAWAELAMAHASLSLWGHDRTTARSERLESAAQESVNLAPAMAESHIAMAQYHRTQLDHSDALASLDRGSGESSSIRAIR